MVNQFGILIDLFDLFYWERTKRRPVKVEARNREDLVKKWQTILEACSVPLPRNPNNGERKDGYDQESLGH